MLALYVAFCFPVSITSGCVYTVRDVGFVDFDTSLYQLCFYVKNSTTQNTLNTFKQISYIALADTNIIAKIVNIDQKTVEQEPAIKYVGLLDIKTFPTAVLISPKGYPLILPDFTQGLSKEQFWSAFEDITISPKRKEILKNITKSHSVVLLIQGKDCPEDNANAKKNVSEAIKETSRTMSQLPKVIERPPQLITITPDQFSQEKVLFWGLGLSENKIDKPYVAILYGKGRQIGNLLAGENLTVNNIFNILCVIGSSCECELDKKWLLGTMIPIKWDREKCLETVKLLGFDPENPLVKTEISQIMATESSSNSDKNSFIGSDNISQAYGYSEVAVDFESKPRKLSPVQIQQMNSPISKVESEFSDEAEPKAVKTNNNDEVSHDDRKPHLENEKKASPVSNQEKITNHKNLELKNGNINPNDRSVNTQAVTVSSVAKGSKTADSSAKLDAKSSSPVFFTTAIIAVSMFLLIAVSGLYIFLRAKRNKP